MGKGKIRSSVLFTEQVEEQIRTNIISHGRGMRLHLHPYVYAYVEKGAWRSLKTKWRFKYGVHTIENQNLGMLEMKFYDKKGDSIEQPNIKEETSKAEK
jgi:ribonuclease G